MFKAFLRGLVGGYNAGPVQFPSSNPVEGSEGYTVNTYAVGASSSTSRITDNATGQVRHWSHSDGCAQTGIAPSDRVW